MRAGETCARSGLCHCPAMLHRRKTAPQTRIVHHETVRRRRARPYSRSANTMEDIIKAAVLGLVEGLTEYIPVSSTGHLLLMQHFFGFGDEGFGNTFAVLIQFGAILALLSIYFGRLVRLALGFFKDATDRRFVLGVLLAFLPAAVVGALAHDFIKGVLFNPWIVCVSLVVGGLVLVWVDSLDLKPRYRDVMA